MQSYTAMIDDEQRLSLIAALDTHLRQLQGPPSPADFFTPTPAPFDELHALKEMLAELPTIEAREPGIIHGLCL